LDLNGVPEREEGKIGMCSAAELKEDVVLGPALSHVDILHLNEEELVNLTGVPIKNDGASSSFEEEETNDVAVATAASLFLKCGVGVVAVTRGSRGCYICCNNEERFSLSKMLPSDWIDCKVKVGAAQLPPGTPINSNGAGDAFTCGLLVAAMLRHTGLCMQVVLDESTKNSSHLVFDEEEEDEALDLSVELLLKNNPVLSSKPDSKNKQMTPYSLYMKEKYVALKADAAGGGGGGGDGKKDIFLKCHDMWENETVEIKQMYERKCKEELETTTTTTDATKQGDTDTLLQTTNSTTTASNLEGTKSEEDMLSRNPSMVNRSMALETAAQFASLVAARHIDMSTRDFLHLDIDKLLEQSIVSQIGLEEI